MAPVSSLSTPDFQKITGFFDKKAAVYTAITSAKNSGRKLSLAAG